MTTELKYLNKKKKKRKKLLEKTGSVIYVQEENWEMSITIFLNVLNLLMKENFF
jgi:hypothetical protein